MLLARDFIGKPVISVDKGKQLGTVKDLFVDADLRAVVGVYLGTEGLFSRKGMCVDRENVLVYGVDAVLVRRSDAVVDATLACESAMWLRRDQFHGQQLATAGGTKVGVVDDLILDEEMHVAGLLLGRVFVQGPVATNRAVARAAIVALGKENAITVDLGIAEQQSLKAE
jgi:uncharacterized protein YrrD